MTVRATLTSFTRARWPRALVAVAAGLVLVSSSPAFAAPTVTEFQVPTPAAGPGDLTLGPDGAEWFAEFLQGAIGRFDGTTFSSFQLPASPSQPDSLTVGPDGAIWATDTENDVIWRITTQGAISSFAIPACMGCYGGGSGTGNIVAGPDGALWYSRPGNDAIGRITTSGHDQEYSVAATGSYPGWITAGPDGALWFTVSEGVARITTAGQFSVVYKGLNYPYAITTGPDGNLWFTGFYEDVIGRLTPSGSAKLFRVPTGCGPSEIASAGGALWSDCYEENVIVRTSTAGAVRSLSVPPPSQFGEIYGMAAGASGTVWFSLLSADRLGQIVTG